MKSLMKNRSSLGVSQRAMADLTGLSFRTVQLMESGKHDPKLSTMKKFASALGYPNKVIERQLDKIFNAPIDSISIISERIYEDGEDSWKIWLFNFVDAFRQRREASYISDPPARGLSPKISALIAGTVETLCEELSIKIPAWCNCISVLAEPWFVSGIENLKASSIAESPIHFRKRKIFVLENFLSRR